MYPVVSKAAFLNTSYQAFGYAVSLLVVQASPVHVAPYAATSLVVSHYSRALFTVHSVGSWSIAVCGAIFVQFFAGPLLSSYVFLGSGFTASHIANVEGIRAIVEISLRILSMR